MFWPWTFEVSWDSESPFSSRESPVEVWCKDQGCVSAPSLWTFSLYMGKEEIQLLLQSTDNFPEKM